MTDPELAMSKTMTPEYVADAPIEPTQVDVSIGEEPGQEKPHEDAQNVADSLGCPKLFDDDKL